MHTAINIKQPWANLIACGEKRIEVRAWYTPYRGKLAIVASARVDADVEVDDPGLLWPRGAIVCVAELVDVRPLVPSDAPATLAYTASEIRRAAGPLFAWELARPRAVEPRRVRGRLGLYRISTGLVVPV